MNYCCGFLLLVYPFCARINSFSLSFISRTLSSLCLFHAKSPLLCIYFAVSSGISLGSCRSTCCWRYLISSTDSSYISWYAPIFALNLSFSPSRFSTSRNARSSSSIALSRDNFDSRSSVGSKFCALLWACSEEVCSLSERGLIVFV